MNRSIKYLSLGIWLSVTPLRAQEVTVPKVAKALTTITPESAGNNPELLKQLVKNLQDELEKQKKLDPSAKEIQRQVDTYALTLKLVEAQTKLAKAEMEMANTQRLREDFEERRRAKDSVRTLENPFVEATEAEKARMDLAYDGILYISERRIDLNGAIQAGVADRIDRQLNYYNSLNTKLPIFLVIGNSPGGSVSEGNQILDSMRASQAPVYVVVKGSAASMAAAITTMAEKSFISPRGRIMHHQMSTGVSGNVSEIGDGAAELGEWWVRFGTPIAKKMGLSSEQEFIKRMYEKRKSGDWEEFAQRARELHWVDYVAKVVETRSQSREEAMKEEPNVLSIFGSAEAGKSSANEIRNGRPVLRKAHGRDFFWMADLRNYIIE